MTAPDLSQRHRAAVDVARASQPSPAPRGEGGERRVAEVEALRIEVESQRAEVARLRAESDTSRDHRTRVQTLLGLAGAAALVVVLGAVSVRDAVLRLESAGAQREARITALESAGARRDTDDRGTREAVVRLQTTVQALETTLVHRLDSIDARLAAQPAPAPHR